jgi:hypothetical protein
MVLRASSRMAVQLAFIHFPMSLIRNLLFASGLHTSAPPSEVERAVPDQKILPFISDHRSLTIKRL